MHILFPYSRQYSGYINRYFWPGYFIKQRSSWFTYGRRLWITGWIINVKKTGFKQNL